MTSIARNADGSLTLADGDKQRIVSATTSEQDRAKAIASFFSTAIESVPEKVTNYQARQALIAAGLFEATNAAVKDSGDLSAQQAWDYANEFYRNSPFIAALSEKLGLTAGQVDDLFRSASRVL